MRFLTMMHVVWVLLCCREVADAEHHTRVYEEEQEGHRTAPGQGSQPHLSSQLMDAVQQVRTAVITSQPRKQLSDARRHVT